MRRAAERMAQEIIEAELEQNIGARSSEDANELPQRKAAVGLEHNG